jgi:hypothetical protein
MRASPPGLHPTQYKFAHWRSGESGRELLWASGVGELDEALPEASPVTRELLAARSWSPNALADQGEQSMLDVYFRAGSPPASFYLGLWNDTPVDTDTLADLTGEVSGTGYARIAAARNSTDFPTLALASGDYQVTSVTKTFTASGTWSAATAMVLCTAATGTAGLHIAWVMLSATRTLIDGDSLDVSLSVKLS